MLKRKIDRLAAKLRKIGRPDPYGHAFIWGSVPLTLKSGKTKCYKACIASICTDDLLGCLKACSDDGILNPYYVLD